jgi:hypothetical protein
LAVVFPTLSEWELRFGLRLSDNMVWQVSIEKLSPLDVLQTLIAR